MKFYKALWFIPFIVLLTACGDLDAESVIKSVHTDPVERLTVRDYSRYLQQASKPVKPGSSSVSGNDSCQFANDRECDEPGFGTGACRAGTDVSDCYRIMTDQEDDSCQWANDGECDEPFFGTGACTQGTDRTDCGDVRHLRFEDDTCDTALNGVCEEPGSGNGRCEDGTDRGDCLSLERPMTIQDHFFGRDDRQIMDTSVFPWSVIGYVEFESGGTCTATLIGPDILVTASHCVHDGNGQLRPAGEFITGENMRQGPYTARVTDVLIDTQFNHRRFSETDDDDGLDWALLRIDQPLGNQLGHVGVTRLSDQRRLADLDIYQAGYSWDTGTNLSGNQGCRVLEVFDDNTISHNCDTTRGDSGSPFMIRNGDDWQVVATDSSFRSNSDGPFIYIAARSDRWVDYVGPFARGEVGLGGTRPQATGKPQPQAVKG